MIVAPGDQPRILEMILNAHPEKCRLIFIHIPKCAGTDLATNLAARYPVVHQTLSVPAWTPPEILQSAVDALEQQLATSDSVLVTGHHRLQWVVKNGIHRPGKDSLFTVIREPNEIILSALNYMIGKLVADTHGDQPDTRGWLRNLGVNDVTGWEPRDLAARALVSGAIPQNALCHFLGQNTAASALDTIRKSGIEITETTRYSKWAEATWGFSFNTRHNASKQLIGLDELPAGVIADLCGEDLVLYPNLMKELGHRLSFTLGPRAPVNVRVEAEQHENLDDLGMLPDVVTKIARLPRLSPRAHITSAIPCKICEAPAFFFDAVDFLKCTGGYPFGPSGILVPYHRCEACGFLFTPFFDSWTSHAFRRFIYNDDYVSIDPEYVRARPVRVAARLAEVLASVRGSRVLDWGAGNGVFAEELLEKGFRAESYDPLSAPSLPTGKYQIITCIEAIEHAPNPLRAFEQMVEHLADEGVIILGETLQPDDIERIRCSWWYIAPRNGHCSTFDRRTLARTANRLGLVFRTAGAGGPHALHRPHIGALNDIAARLGPAIAYFRLGAPGDTTTGWNAAERPADGPPYQWTGATEVSWDLTVPPGPKRKVIVDLPPSSM